MSQAMLNVPLRSADPREPPLKHVAPMMLIFFERRNLFLKKKSSRMISLSNYENPGNMHIDPFVAM